MSAYIAVAHSGKKNRTSSRRGRLSWQNNKPNGPPKPKTGNRNNDVLAVESHLGKSTRWPFRLTTGEHPARESPALVTLGGISVESSEARCHTRRRVFSCSHTMARSTSGEVIGLSIRKGWVRLRAPPAGWSGSFRCSTRIFPARPADSGPNPPKVG